MAVKKQCQLHMVTEAIDHLIAETIKWIILQESQNNNEQLVLTTERVKALQHLKTMAHKELKSATNTSERVWQVVNLVVATTIRYVLGRLSDASNYKFSHICYGFSTTIVA